MSYGLDVRVHVAVLLQELHCGFMAGDYHVLGRFPFRVPGVFFEERVGPGFNSLDSLFVAVGDGFPVFVGDFADRFVRRRVPVLVDVGELELSLVPVVVVVAVFCSGHGFAYC